MKKQIQALMSKQRLTGDDAGRLMILDLLSAYEDLAKGGSGTGVLTDAEKTNIVNSLILPNDVQTFNDYRGLHDYLANAPVMSESYVKTYELYSQRLLHLIANIRHAEEQHSFSKYIPAIMTKKQYDLFVESGRPAPYGGIAVLQDFPHSEAGIDENGFYIEPKNIIMDDYMAEKVINEYAEQVISVLNGMKAMLCECLAREKALELVANYVKIPQIKKIVPYVDKESIAVLNTYMTQVPDFVHRDDPMQQEWLREKLRGILQPINLKELEPMPQSVKAARRALNLSVIKNGSEAFIDSIKRKWRNDC